MFRPVLRWLGHRYQRRLGVRTPYFEDVVRYAPGAIVPIVGFVPATLYGHRLPGELLHMIRLGATRTQDCGTCLEIGIHLARRDGVPEPLIESAVQGRAEGLEPELGAALRFGERLGRGEDAPQERELLRTRFGTPGLVEASIAAAGSLTFPALQLGLGHARACAISSSRPGED